MKKFIASSIVILLNSPVYGEVILESRLSSVNPLIINVFITNNTEENVLFAPYKECYENGWSMEIKGIDGKYANIAIPCKMNSIAPEHFVKITPKETYETSYNFSKAVRWDNENDKVFYLAQTPGDYTFSVSYSFDETVFKATKDKRWRPLLESGSFIKTLSSKDLHFSIKQ